MRKERFMKYAAAIREAIDLCMEKDPAVFIIGEGVPDPKGIFGSTSGLQKKYGPARVLGMPVSENALTGICIGAALRGLRPIITHQRVDFCLLALDQIINNAAKWHFMFGGKSSVPMVIRLIVGRGWGQGAQHSQSLQSVFSHIPGLKVIMPTTPYDVKGLLISAVEDNNPVICLEHRWLYGIEGDVPEGMYRIAIGKAKVMKPGTHVTVVANSHMTIESLKAAHLLEKKGIQAEVIDLRTIKPLDEDLIVESVKKTGLLLVVDGSWITGGITGEIIARTAQKAFQYLKAAPRRIALPDVPTPSSAELSKNFYPDFRNITKNILELLGKDENEIDFLSAQEQKIHRPHDVPDLSFKGPF